MKPQIFKTRSKEETQIVAEEFAKTLKGGEVLCLYGDLGFGKTTFLQGLAKGLGIERRVNSPTFIIMRSYRIKGIGLGGQGTDKEKTLYHVDLYRINHEQEIIDLGLLDMMNNPENIVAIEWPEKLGTLLSKKRIDIHFEYLEENVRKVTITKV